MHDLGGMRLDVAPQTCDSASIQSAPFPQGMDWNAGSIEFRCKCSRLKQAQDLAFVAIGLLDPDKIQDHALQSAAIQIFHYVRDVHGLKP
jgi:hypothetical protein